MRICLCLAAVAMSILAGCDESLCDQSWSAERGDLITNALCSPENKGVVEDQVGSLNIEAVEGTMVVIDTDTGRIVRVPSNVVTAENSRLEAVNLNAPGAETIRPSAEAAGLDVFEGMGFMVVAQDAGPEQAFLVAESITIGPTYVRVIGSRSLTLLGATVSLEGIVDVAAGCPDDPTNMVCGGPGGGDGANFQAGTPPGGCAPGGAGTGSEGDDTGGGGGGLGAPGARGGNSLADPLDPTSVAREGGAGGDIAACPDPALLAFQGGSGGGYGEGGLDGEDTGKGGGGGGAFRIIAACELRMGAGSPRIAGVWAGGGGGSPGTLELGRGGGGGGSGGAILLEAPVISLTEGTVLAANGGSGGSGGFNETGALAGTYGPFSDLSAPGAGVSPFAGGAGGSAAMPAQTGSDDVNVDGSGGGGGSVGIIRINTRARGLSEIGVTTSPPASKATIAN